MVSAGWSSGILDQPTWRRAGPGERTNIKEKKKYWVEPNPGKHCLPKVLQRRRKEKKKGEKIDNKKKGKRVRISVGDSNSPSPGASLFVVAFAKPSVVLAPANIGLGDAGAPV
jgi:hypothetical protein